MVAEITLDDEVSAADLFVKCVRLVSLDAAWTSRLGGVLNSRFGSGIPFLGLGKRWLQT